MAPHGKVLVNASIRHRLCKNDFSHLSKASRKQSKKKVRQSFESTNNSEIFNVSSGGNPILCLQKRILSPSCLPAFGKFDFRSLYRLISHCERDFSFASERDSHFFDKMIVSHFSFHVNHVKLFHLVVLDLRSVRDPGLPPCPDALLRVGVMRGWMMGWSLFFQNGFNMYKCVRCPPDEPTKHTFIFSKLLHPHIFPMYTSRKMVSLFYNLLFLGFIIQSLKMCFLPSYSFTPQLPS